MSTLTEPLTHPTPLPVRHEPVQVAPETWVIQATHGEGIAPIAVHMNAMVIRGAEPVVVDTGAPVNRDQYLEDLFGLVEPDDVRWVFISHDDVDHYGNLHEVMDACPNATLVASWFLCERMSVGRLDVAPTRWRWVGDGESFDAGDRTLTAIRPPLYDSPTTRGLLDHRTGVYWAADCYGAGVERGTAYASDLDPDFWAHSFETMQAWTSPWVSALDPQAHLRSCRHMEGLGITTIASAHGPTIGSASLDQAFALMRTLPAATIDPQPGQPVLDDIIASMTVQTGGAQ
ncbi:MAG: MBL fold metallo-hydrolase [Acidimicrobiia bacterium]|nr:MBL fold metallo-hydrolase [Acidimicrobiia bacterium]